MSINTNKLIKKLWSKIDKKRKNQFYGLIILSIFVSIVEIISIGALFPFLEMISRPDKYTYLRSFNSSQQLFNVKEWGDLILFSTIAFSLMILMSAGARLLLLFVTTKLSFVIGKDISGQVFYKTVNQTYLTHVNRNSSEIIDAISTKCNSIIFGVIVPILIIISSAFMVCLIILGMLVVEPIVTIGLFLMVSIFYIGILNFTKKIILINGQNISTESTKLVKIIQEALGGIRDIIINKSQHSYCEYYNQSDGKLRAAQVGNIIIGQSPRYIIEALGMIVVAVIACLLTIQMGELNNAVPILGVLAFGAQRLIPIIHQIYSSIASIQGNKSILKDVLDLLEQPLNIRNKKSVKEKINFESSLELRGVQFKYGDENNWILKNINLKINRGDCIGITGVSGAGKSTLIDVITGLLKPIGGSVNVDGVMITAENVELWQEQIASVPQQIFLIDSTIEKNIALGVEEKNIKMDKLIDCAEKAQVLKFIDKLPTKLKTTVGERGVRLSGGQIQRIGIARALYKDPKLIIFDEATSGLDNETENSIMDVLKKINKKITIIIISHRLTTLKNCSKIIKLSEGEIIER